MSIGQFLTRRLAGWAGALALVLAGSCAILTVPLTSRQGIDDRVTTFRIPAYVKATDFVQRHLQYRLLVSRICAGKTSDLECVMAIFDWTHKTIRPTPPGWPVIDSHTLNIIIRGHGTDGQMAAVFVTLATYSGSPAFWRFMFDPSGEHVLPLSFVRLKDRWIPFDVANHVLFRNDQGELADVDDLVDDPALLGTQTVGALPDDVAYSNFISRRTLSPFDVPNPLRAEMQQPLPRLRYELRRIVGLEPQ